MLPAIGIMIGCYIITRMISLLSRINERKESIIVKLFCVITIIITLLCMLSLFAIPDFNTVFPSK